MFHFYRFSDLCCLLPSSTAWLSFFCFFFLAAAGSAAAAAAAATAVLPLFMFLDNIADVHPYILWFVLFCSVAFGLVLGVVVCLVGRPAGWSVGL